MHPRPLLVNGHGVKHFESRKTTKLYIRKWSEQFFIPFSSLFLCSIYNRSNVILVQFWNYWLYCGKILLVQNVRESGRCRQECFAITNCQFLLFALTAIAYYIIGNSPLIADSIYFLYVCDKKKAMSFYLLWHKCSWTQDIDSPAHFNHFSKNCGDQGWFTYRP